MFKNIYSFNAFDKITEGETVVCFDKRDGKSHTLNEMRVSEAAALVRAAQGKEDVISFFSTAEHEAEKQNRNVVAAVLKF